jgi:hypothetical protein
VRSPTGRKWWFPDHPAASNRLGDAQVRPTAAEELLEIVMRRYERASTLLTSNHPVEDWGKLLGDSAAVTAMLDRLLHHGHLLKCGPPSWGTKTDLPDQANTRQKDLIPGHIRWPVLN